MSIFRVLPAYFSNLRKDFEAVNYAGLNDTWKISLKFFSQYRFLLSSEEPWFLECSILIYTSMSQSPINFVLQVKIISVVLLLLVLFFINISFLHVLIFRKRCCSAIFPSKGYFHQVVLFFKISRCNFMRNGSSVGGECICFAESLWLILYY